MNLDESIRRKRKVLKIMAFLAGVFARDVATRDIYPIWGIHFVETPGLLDEDVGS